MKFFFTLLVLSISCIARSGNENFPIGSRSSAMGNASVSLSDVWSTHHNQAGLAFIHDISTGVYYENRFLIKELSIKGGVLAIPVKGGTFGLCISNFGYSLYSENKYSLSFAKSFGDQFAAGIAMNCLSTRIAEGYGNKNVFAVEIGIQAKPLKEITIGAHVFNPTRAKLADYANERIPTVFRLGADYNFSEKVTLAIETEKDISQKAIFKAGIEYKAVKELYLRAGISTDPTLSSFGLGLNLKNLKIDLSTNYHQTLGISPQLSLTYVFKKTEISN
ncbi:MAG: hypothetical protein ACT4ON_07495 [Bacteroidota bacterium]